MWPGAPIGRTPAGRSVNPSSFAMQVLRNPGSGTRRQPSSAIDCDSQPLSVFLSSPPCGAYGGWRNPGAPGRRSGEELRMLLQFQPGTADVGHQSPFRVVRVLPADAVEQQAVLQVRDAQAGRVRRQPGELPPVVLG